MVAMHDRLNKTLFNEMLAGRRVVLVVDEAQGLAEIAEPEFPLDAMSVVADFPIWSLIVQAAGLLARERRDTAAARRTGFLGKSFRHGCVLSSREMPQNADDPRSRVRDQPPRGSFSLGAAPRPRVPEGPLSP